MDEKSRKNEQDANDEELFNEVEESNEKVRQLFEKIGDVVDGSDVEEVSALLGMAWGEQTLLVQRQAFYAGFQAAMEGGIEDGMEVSFDMWLNTLLIKRMQYMIDRCQEEQEPEEQIDPITLN